jgi:hypothetical protein
MLRVDEPGAKTSQRRKRPHAPFLRIRVADRTYRAVLVRELQRVAPGAGRVLDLSREAYPCRVRIPLVARQARQSRVILAVVRELSECAVFTRFLLSYGIAQIRRQRRFVVNIRRAVSVVLCGFLTGTFAPCNDVGQQCGEKQKYHQRPIPTYVRETGRDLP